MIKILLTLTTLLVPLASYSVDEVGTFWRAKHTQVDAIKASPGEVFRLNQVITTTKSSRAKAELRTIDNSRYIIYKNSSIKFEEFEMAGSSCNGMKVSLVQGKMRGTSGSCGHGKTEIKTAVAGAFAWGTDYEMMYVPKGKTIEGYENVPAGFYQKVNEGKVMVSNENGSLLINPGEAGFVGIEGTAPKIIPLPDFFTNVEKPVVKKETKPKKKEEGQDPEPEKSKEEAIEEEIEIVVKEEIEAVELVELVVEIESIEEEDLDKNKEIEEIEESNPEEVFVGGSLVSPGWATTRFSEELVDLTVDIDVYVEKLSAREPEEYVGILDIYRLSEDQPYQQVLDINQETENPSKIYLGIWDNFEVKIDGITQDLPEGEEVNDGYPIAFIYENGNDSEAIGGGMMLPVAGSIKYDLELASPVSIDVWDETDSTINNIITDDYSLKEVLMNVSFDTNAVSAQIVITDNITSSDIISNINETILNEFTGVFESEYYDDGLSSSEEDQGNIYIYGAMMGVEGSHIGMGYHYNLPDAEKTLFGLAVLKQADDQNGEFYDPIDEPQVGVYERYDKGTLIKMNQSSTITVAPYSSYGGDYYLESEGYSEPNTPYYYADGILVEKIGEETNNIYFCEYGSSCNEDRTGVIHAGQKITKSRSTSNFESSFVINEGTIDESIVNWGFWKTPNTNNDKNSGDSYHYSDIYDYNDASELFIYEDTSDAPSFGDDFHLPRDGVLDYSVQSASPTLYNDSNDVSSGYTLNSDNSSLSIDFGTNDVTTTLSFDDIYEENVINTTGTGSLIDATRMFEISSNPSAADLGTNLTDDWKDYDYIDENSGQKIMGIGTDANLTMMISRGDFNASGAMMGKDGSHAGMLYRVYTEYESMNNISGAILFKAN